MVVALALALALAVALAVALALALAMAVAVAMVCFQFCVVLPRCNTDLCYCNADLHYTLHTTQYTLHTQAERTVNHIQSYMRSFPNWAYMGGAQAGDIGNGGKWYVAAETGFAMANGKMHYRAGLNQIPLSEWYVDSDA